MLCNEFQTRLVYIIKSQPEKKKRTIYYLLCSGFISPLVKAKEFRITYKVQLFQSSTVISLQKKSSLHLLLLYSLICCGFLLPYRALALSFIMLISELVQDYFITVLYTGASTLVLFPSKCICFCSIKMCLMIAVMSLCSFTFSIRKYSIFCDSSHTIYHHLTLICCIY